MDQYFFCEFLKIAAKKKKFNIVPPTKIYVKKKYFYYWNMKNIKQYFINNTKYVDMKVVADPSTTMKQEKDQEETIAMGKRKRVKIRISRNISKQRTCDIIENKNDLIDKTPSPLNVKVNNDKDVAQDGTPKSHLADLKWHSKKVSNL